MTMSDEHSVAQSLASTLGDAYLDQSLASTLGDAYLDQSLASTLGDAYLDQSLASTRGDAHLNQSLSPNHDCRERIRLVLPAVMTTFAFRRLASCIFLFGSGTDQPDLVLLQIKRHCPRSRLCLNILCNDKGLGVVFVDNS